jgi:hypothetical protein
MRNRATWVVVLAWLPCQAVAQPLERDAPRSRSPSVEQPPASAATYGLGVSGGYAYQGGGDGFVVRVPKAGGTAVVLTRAQSPSRLALDGDVLYVATARGVLRVPVNGGEAVALGLGPTEHVAVDDSFVYFGWWSRDVYRAAK